MASDTPKLRLYNTLSRTKEDFAPLDPANVRMYVCGPTVYDFAHIGNARPVIVFDVLYRLLRHVYAPECVTYVRNITDVDDKIIDRARRDFPADDLNSAIAWVTVTTTTQFQADAAALGCLPPTHEPRATAHIPGMIALVEKLLGNGHAYEADGEVLFAVESMPDYGALSNRRLEDQQPGARVAVEAHKRHPGDFVLWKLSGDDEPGWDSPWGRGRPGWHIECSAMSEALLGKTFDIHGGGLDLIFPHHENEIAQSRCAHGTEMMAQVWMHNGYLQVEGRKMSKSEGNFVTIHDLLETRNFGGRKWSGEVLRLAMLMTHYREPLDFSVKRLEEAEHKLRSWQRTAAGAGDAEGEIDADVVAQLADDLNFVRAATALDVIARKANRGAATAAACLARTLEFFGFASRLPDIAAEAAISEADDTLPGEAAIEDAISRRLALIAEKNFAEADRIREELSEKGIQLMDYRDPETGERRTKWEAKG